METISQACQKGACFSFIALIKFYQFFISPLLGPRCRFYPCCSSYAISALQVHGIFKGTALSLLRLLRCQPFSRGGLDPVPCPKHKPFLPKG